MVTKLPTYIYKLKFSYYSVPIFSCIMDTLAGHTAGPKTENRELKL